jgi:hypothetical protein
MNMPPGAIPAAFVILMAAQQPALMRAQQA